MRKQPTLNWSDRFAVIDHYTPTDEQICEAFRVTQDELDTARSLRANGTFVANHQLNATKYKNIFGASVTKSTPSATSNKPKSTATIHTKPETATKKVKVPQKRGRKGDRIHQALLAVTDTPVSVDVFMKQHNVSLAVLRQSKRFMEKLTPTEVTKIGTINVRQDKTSRKLVIWAVKP